MKRKIMIPLRRAFALTLVAALVFACQSGGPASPGEEPVVVRVELSATTLALGPAADRASFSLENVGEGSVSWRIEAISATWMTVDPSSGTLAPDQTVTLTVTIRRAGLSPGSHVGTIRIEVGDRAYDVTVSLEHAGTPRAGLSPSSLDLGAEDGSADLTIRNIGDAPLEWTLSGPAWAAFDPASGTTAPGGVNQSTVTVDRSGLAPGTHTAEISLDSNGGGATTSLTVVVPEPARLRLDPGEIDFGTTATTGTLTVVNEGDLALDWSAEAGAGWASVEPAGGSLGPRSSVAVTVRASRAGLAAGSHQTTLRVRSNGGDGSVALRLEVPEPQDGGDDGSGGSDSGGSDPGGSGSGTVALEGRVVDQFSGSGVAGVTVRFDGATVQTGDDGGFQLEGTSSDQLRALNLSGGGVITRNTYARTGDTQWLAIPGTFDMAAFDDMARDYEPRTIRWVRDPDVYFDVTPPDGFPPGSELDTWIEEVRGVIEGFVSGWTNGRIRAASLTVGTSPPASGTPGVIVIGFSEDPTRYSDSRTVGLARTFWTTNRSIYSARIWLRFSRISGTQYSSVRTAVVGHELGHALGMGHMDGNTSSIMTPSISAWNLTSFDRKAGGVVYSRSPGNTSPDNDDSRYYRGGLAPAAAGFHEWICDAPERTIHPR